MSRSELVRIRLRSDFSPEQALLALRSDRRPFALVGRWAGGGAILGSEPIEVAAAGADPFELLDRQPAVEAVDGVAVGGGWFGYLGYGLGALVEALPPPPPRPAPLPDHSLAFYDHVLRRDSDRNWWFEALSCPATRERIERRRRVLSDRLEGQPPLPRSFRCADFEARPAEQGYRRAVEECLAYIRAGDLYQANLALRLEATFHGLGLDLFASAAADVEPAYGAYFATPGGEIASLSPELFLRRRDRELMTAPIKGTTPRTPDPEVAAVESRALAGSAKDRAENVMIVDLMRNDLGRVCEPGSISVGLPENPEAHPGVWHLVSRVGGRLRAGVSDAQLLRATFPPGSVTGAPKIKAQEVISTLESTAREAYTGAIGYASPLAGLELNVAIRTFEIAGGRIWLGAGAGIVADSDPAGEYAEAMAKAEPLVVAAGSRVMSTGSDSNQRVPAQPRPVRVPRPDPALGIFETVLVVDGLAMELDRHIDRLRGSSAALYGEAPNAERLQERIAAEARGSERARLRARLAPRRDGGLDLGVETAPVSQEGPEARHIPLLVPVTVPGGLGSHKWIDRGLVDEVAATPGLEALLLDLDGSVLETGAGNLWIVVGGALRTPPSDGRMLPGVTRSVLLELAGAFGMEVGEDELTLPSIAEADEVFISSSVRGIRPARLEDGQGSTGEGEVRRSLSEALCRRWTGQPSSYSAI